jgi:hypothetical protein
MNRFFGLLQVAAASAALTGCGDPVLDARISALGPEQHGIRPGEFHRPGQPCTYCHSDYGPGPPFSIAGTIFGVPAKNANSEPVPVDNAVVTMTDTTGVSKVARTNCVGSFFFRSGDYDPQFPLHVVVEANVPKIGAVRKVMATRVDRATSCAECHLKEQSETSPGWVFVYQDPLNANARDPFSKPSPSTCQGAANFP